MHNRNGQIQQMARIAPRSVMSAARRILCAGPALIFRHKELFVPPDGWSDGRPPLFEVALFKIDLRIAAFPG